MAAGFIPPTDLGLEGNPCADAAGDLNGCALASAMVIGFCACGAGYDDDGEGGDKAEI